MVAFFSVSSPVNVHFPHSYVEIAIYWLTSRLLNSTTIRRLFWGFLQHQLSCMFFFSIPYRLFVCTVRSPIYWVVSCTSTLDSTGTFGSRKTACLCHTSTPVPGFQFWFSLSLSSCIVNALAYHHSTIYWLPKNKKQQQQKNMIFEHGHERFFCLFIIVTRMPMTHIFHSQWNARHSTREHRCHIPSIADEPTHKISES